jgi:hypothetical protein
MAKTKNGQITSRAVINRVKIDSLPSFSFDTSTRDLIPFGADNLYPQRMFKAIAKSPTATGVIKRVVEFIFGHGLVEGGDVVVNRDGQTMNDILMSCVQSYAKYSGFAIHFNYNLLGEVVEWSMIDLRYVRKSKDLTKIIFGDFAISNAATDNTVEIDVFNPDKVKEQIAQCDDDIKGYKGQVFYWTSDFGIYPTSMLDTVSGYASYENESQVYQNANIQNGLSGSKILKYPEQLFGESSLSELESGNNPSIENEGKYPGDEVDNSDSSESKLEANLRNITGSDRAGSILVVKVPTGVSGEFKDFKLLEDISPTNVDDIFINQNEKAENSILKAGTMPKILLGISDSGMFNQASFNDAFDYKNADTEGDRKIIERVFAHLLESSVFNISNVEIEPLEMRAKKQEAKEEIKEVQEEVPEEETKEEDDV